MHRFIRPFLLWLLLAALPLQGFAAAMQLSCGPMEQPAPASAAMSMSMSPGHHGQASPGHQHDAEADAAAQPSAPDHSSMDARAASSCSACSACCVGAVALPVDTVVTPVYGTAVPAPLPASPLLADFIPGGLERPPKRITA